MMPPQSAPVDQVAAAADTAAYIALARAVVKMRRVQTAYFKLRRDQPHKPHRAELDAARSAERVVDSLTAAALERERAALPGLGAEGGVS